MKPEVPARVQEICLWLRSYAGTKLNSVLMDERRTVPPYVVLDFGNQGLLGLTVPSKLGGLELRPSDVLTIMEQLGAIDLTLAIFAGIHNGLGIRPIERFGSEALKEELLPKLAAGRILGALAVTERGAGSNPHSIEANATPEGTGWRLRGSKIWIGNGSWAGVINVFARQPLNQGGGMNAFAVRATAPGLRVGPEALTMGMRAIVQNEIFLDDVFVSREDLLGAEGEGFAVGEDSFGFARLGISAIALGGLRRAIQVAHRYAGRRKIATGLSLDNAKTREILSALVCAAACLESLVEMTGTLCNQSGAAPAHLSAICKIVGPELLWTGVDRVVQLMGGRGYIEPNLLPQMLRDARLLRIFEGPTETLEMHLGAAILGEFVTYDSLYGSLNAPKATALVREIVSAIAGELDRTTGHGRMMATQRAKLSVGHLAAWGAIAAAAEHRHAANPHDKMNEVAFRWAFADLERRITDLKRGTPGLMDASALNSVVSGYVDHIGDIEQTLPGADYLIDPLLRRDH